MTIRFCAWIPAALVLGACASPGGPSGATPANVPPRPSSSPERTDSMQLGSFTVCLRVKDLAASRAFYEKLGFAQVAGDASHGYLVLRNGTTKIGLFRGHIEKTTLTFNPGWSSEGEPLADFTDVRELQRTLEQRGVTLKTGADPASTGPAYLILDDPDGNPIYVDQHVPKPAR